jgi:hypothetical protein
MMRLSVGFLSLARKHSDETVLIFDIVFLPLPIIINNVSVKPLDELITIIK